MDPGNVNIPPPKENYYGIISGTYIDWFNKNKGKILGEGSYGDVKEYDNKVVKISKSIKYGLDASLIREASYISKLRHPNVINLIDAFFTEKNFCMILPKADIDLFQYYKKKPLKDEEIISISYQIIRGVAYLHSQDILHGDLKPQNILLFKDDNGKCLRAVIADFGISRDNTCRKIVENHEVFTLWYRPPEILLGGTYTAAGDIWALGCIIYQITTNHTLFPGDDEELMLKLIFSRLGTPTEQIWPGISLLPKYSDKLPQFTVESGKIYTSNNEINLILHQMVVLDPGKRANTLSLLNHKIFDNLKNNLNICLKAPDIPSINCNVSIIENAINISDFKSNFYPIPLKERLHNINVLYKIQKEEHLDDKIIHFTILLFDKFIREIDTNSYMSLLYSCLYVSYVILNFNEPDFLGMVNYYDIIEEDELTHFNIQIIIKSKLDLHISVPLDILDVYITAEMRELGILCLNLINYTSLPQRYPSEFIALLAFKMASDFLNKEFRYQNRLESLGNVEEAYKILIEDLNKLNIKDISVINRGIYSVFDIKNRLL